MERHIKLLGALYIIFGSLFLIGAIVIYFALTTAGLLSGDETAIFVTEIVALAVGAFLLVISIPGIIAGIGLLKYRLWAKTLALIIGLINLINFPIGTIIGVYTIWVLMNSQTEKFFADRS